MFELEEVDREKIFGQFDWKKLITMVKKEWKIVWWKKLYFARLKKDREIVGRMRTLLFKFEFKQKKSFFFVNLLLKIVLITFLEYVAFLGNISYK